MNFFQLILCVSFRLGISVEQHIYMAKHSSTSVAISKRLILRNERDKQKKQKVLEHRESYDRCDVYAAVVAAVVS